MEFIYEAERIYVKDASGRMAAQVTFHQRSDRAMSIDHTYVSPSSGGRGRRESCCLPRPNASGSGS